MATSYGTVNGVPQHENQNDTTNGSAIDSADAEHHGLLTNNTSKSTGSSLASRLRNYLTAEVSRNWGDLPLLLCYFITGLLDTSSVNTWGSFVSMQTGNTIYLGYGIVAPREDDRWIRALTSLVCFQIGSFLFSRFHRYFHARHRWVLVASSIIQMVLITCAALAVTLGPPPATAGTTSAVLGPVALLALQSAGQAFMSRVLGYGSLTSVVLTSIYCDLWGDEDLFAPVTKNPERNRRIAAPVMLLAGAMVAGVMDRSPVGLAGALWTAVGVKALIAVAWWFWAVEGGQEDEGA